MRGSFRGRGRGGLVRGGYSGPPAPFIYAVRPPPFDIHCCSADIFEQNREGERELSEDVAARAGTLTPNETDSEAVIAFWGLVRASIEKIKEANALPALKIEEVHNVGSWAKETSLAYNNVADLTVVLGTIPTPECISTLGTKIVELLREGNSKELISFYPRDYGCLVTSPNVQVKVLITTVPENAGRIEPELHLASTTMMFNYYAIRHAQWFADSKTLSKLTVLVRVLKDVRNRHEGLQPLSVWALEYLAQFCLLNTPNRQELPLGTAFRRFFELLASGILLPRTPVLIDPTNTSNRIGFDLTLDDMDKLCSTAQTLLRIICSCRKGFDAVLGMDPLFNNTDLSKQSTVWEEAAISPLEVAVHADCMAPFTPDEQLTEKMEAIATN